MKKLLRYFFIAFIGLAVLSTSVGITISKMVCKKSGKASIAFGKMQGCCKRNKKSACDFEQSCCDILNTDIKSDTHIFSKKTETPPVKEIALLPASVTSQNITLFSPAMVDFETPDIPPKPSGRSLLLIISRFTI